MIILVWKAGCILLNIERSSVEPIGILSVYKMYSIIRLVILVLSCLGFFDQNEINKIMEESVKMKQFNHPNVMNLIGVCTNAGPAPYLVMPFMTNGSLLSYLKNERPNLLLDETADEDLVRALTHLPTIYNILLLLLLLLLLTS